MSTAQLNPPKPFDFAKPESWIKWRRRFECYRQASNLIDKSGDTQISTLIYSMGDQAKDILVAFGLTKDELKNYVVVLANFEGQFVKKRNVI